jgi:uncharacterized membrane protein
MSAVWVGYGAALLVMGVLDALWLGVIARDLYRREIGELMAAQVQVLPAALFYCGDAACRTCLMGTDVPRC